jgi:hypothetical protein
MSPHEETLRVQASCRARQREWTREIHLEILQSIPNDELPYPDLLYHEELQMDATKLNSPRPHKKVKGNDHTILPIHMFPPSNDTLPHKRPNLLPEGARIINPGHAFASSKKAVHTPKKKPYIPYCPPAFQNQTLEVGKSPIASTLLRYIMLDDSSNLPHEGPTVIAELTGATHDVNNVFSQSHNPHYGTTKTGNRPEHPPTTPIPYTAGPFPKVALSYATLFGNLHEESVKQIQSHPENL